MMKTVVEKHFDNLAQNYDSFKRKNWYYYQNVKKLYKQLIPENSTVLEVGCGTGDLIAHLNAKKAVGIDISTEMIKIAQQKYPQIHFESTTIEHFESEIQFEYIFFADVIEHLEDIPSTIKVLSRICDQDSHVIFSYGNPLWEPVLLLLEKLSLKMPEGPHYRIPYNKLKKIFEQFGFRMFKRDWRLIFPAYVQYFSELINNLFFHIPGLKRLGLIEYVVLKKEK